MMKIMEIISVRTSINQGKRVREVLNTICREIKESSAAKADVYDSSDFPGDLAIILSWEGTSLKEEKTSRGHTISVALRQFGLIDHVLWVMDEGDTGPERQKHNI